MQMNGQQWSFDARSVDTANAFGAQSVPEGWYRVIIRKSNFRPTRDTTGAMIALEMEIVEGELRGRPLFWNFNIVNNSEKAVEIAYKQLGALSQILGQYNLVNQGVQDHCLPMLHNQPFFVHAVVAQGNNGPINNIKNIRDNNGVEPGKAAAGPIHQQPAAAPPYVGPSPAPQPGPTFGGTPAMPSQVSAPGGWAPPAGSPAVPAGTPAPGGWQSGPAPAPQTNPAPPPQGYGAPPQATPPQGQPVPPQPGGPAWNASPAQAAPPPGGAAWTPPGGGAPPTAPQGQPGWGAQASPATPPPGWGPQGGR